MHPTSIRLTEAENAVLQACAEQHKTSAGALIRRAAMKLVQHLGAPERTTKPLVGRPTAAQLRDKAAGAITLTVTLRPADVAALQTYRARNNALIEDGPKWKAEDAVRAAMRVGLVHRGDLTLNPGSSPDWETAEIEVDNTPFTWEITQ